jgi:hypothetical protein
VHLALREFIAQRRRLDMRDLRGRVPFAQGYDPKRLREDPAGA